MLQKTINTTLAEPTKVQVVEREGAGERLDFATLHNLWFRASPAQREWLIKQNLPQVWHTIGRLTA
jgi:hypothetical protein